MPVECWYWRQRAMKEGAHDRILSVHPFVFV